MINQNKKLFLTIFVLSLIAGLAVSFSLGWESWMRIAEIDNQLSNRNNLNSPDNGESDNGSNTGDDNQKLEIYQAELFVRAPWGDGQGEVGLSNPSKRGVEDAGPNYGPQSFDIAENGHLFLLDSVNERVIEYDDQGEYLKDFPIACGGTGDIRISPDGKYLYVFSWRCEGVYKYDIEGEFLEGYGFSREMKSGSLGTEGLEFDKEGNIMIELGMESYDKEDRFCQVGKNGDEWENNNFIGHPLNNKDEYCLLGGIIKSTGEIERHIIILDENKKSKKKIKIELPKKGLPYFTGLDKNDNIYLEIQYVDGSSDNEIRKYNQEDNLLTVLDVSKLMRENDFIWHYTKMFNDSRVSKNGDVYLMFSDPSEIKIYKYSKK